MSFERGTDRHAYFGFGSSGDVFTLMNEESAGTVRLGTAGTVALTLDSSQNATFAGKLEVNQAGDGTSNVPSAVAEFSGQNAGGVLRALSLVNSVTAASGNGTELAFHNASNYSPTGTIRVRQAGDVTTDSKMEFQVYRGGLQTVMRIDHDGHVDLLDGNLKINGTTVIDTSRNLHNIGTGSFSGTVSINQGSSFSKLQIGTGRTGATENIGAVEFLNSSSALKAQVYGSNDGKLRLTTNGSTIALTLDSSQVATFENTIDVKSQSSLLQRWFEGSTEVGRAIGVSGVQMAIGSGDTGVLFNASVNAVYPWQPTTNAGLDNIVDLGISSRKWRDIYFGGNLKQGSTTVIDSSRNLTNIASANIGGGTSYFSEKLLVQGLARFAHGANGLE